MKVINREDGSLLSERNYFDTTLESTDVPYKTILEDDSIHLDMETTRDDVPGWDSFVYVNFIISAEMAFDITFGVGDVESFETVGDIVHGIRELALA